VEERLADLKEVGQFLPALITLREALRAFPERTYTSNDGNVTIQANVWIKNLQLPSRISSDGTARLVESFWRAGCIRFR